MCSLVRDPFSLSQSLLPKWLKRTGSDATRSRGNCDKEPPKQTVKVGLSKGPKSQLVFPLRPGRLRTYEQKTLQFTNPIKVRPLSWYQEGVASLKWLPSPSWLRVFSSTGKLP